MSFSLLKLLVVVTVIPIALVVFIKLGHPILGPAIVMLTILGSVAYLLPKSRMPMLVLSPLLLFAILISSVALSAWPPIYYAQYNAVKSKLAALPGVKIVDSWKHEDVTLEDCGFTLVIRDSIVVELAFIDGQDWVGMFKKLDGVVFWMSGGKTHCATTAQLIDRGLSVKDLPDLLKNADKLLVISQEADTFEERWPMSGRYLHVWSLVQSK